MSFELAWKVLKDYFDLEGFSINSPRSGIKQAFQVGLLTAGDLWLKALTDRNLTVHTHDEAIANAVEKKIREEYYPVLKHIYLTMSVKASS